MVSDKHAGFIVNTGNATFQDVLDLIEYVKNIEACFLVEDMIYPPEIQTMISVLMKSRANEFCRNPLGYIKSLK